MPTENTKKYLVSGKKNYKLKLETPQQMPTENLDSQKFIRVHLMGFFFFFWIKQEYRGIHQGELKHLD